MVKPTLGLVEGMSADGHEQEEGRANERFAYVGGSRREPTGPGASRGLLRVQEAAEWLGLSKRKTYQLVSGGELPSVCIGRSRRIALSALERFVERLATGRE